MKTKPLKIQKEKKAQRTMFILLPRYCDACGQGFFLQSVPVVEGLPKCPECQAQNKKSYLWMDKGNALKYYKENMERELKNFNK